MNFYIKFVRNTCQCEKTQCPETHPFAYNDGAGCCALPFEDVDDDFGKDCDASPISLESKCCLNAADQSDLSINCPHSMVDGVPVRVGKMSNKKFK